MTPTALVLAYLTKISPSWAIRYQIQRATSLSDTQTSDTLRYLVSRTGDVEVEPKSVPRRYRLKVAEKPKVKTYEPSGLFKVAGEIEERYRNFRWFRVKGRWLA